MPPNPATTHVPALLLPITLAHLVNDLLQAALPALYPLFKATFALSYTQIGLISLAFHLVAACCQPWIGHLSDCRPRLVLLPWAMPVTASGIVLLATSDGFATLLAAAVLIGLGSSLFHPEALRAIQRSTRVGLGMAHSVFQLGGNLGSALGPLLVALLILPTGQCAIAWLVVPACLGLHLLWRPARRPPPAASGRPLASRAERPGTGTAMAILSLMILANYLYLAAMSNYYSFYLIERFGLTPAQAQLHLFAFLAAIATGTLLGGPLGDRLGYRTVILISLVGSAPFTLWLPHAGVALALPLTLAIGVLMACAFPAILASAQQWLPERVGFVAGYFFGLTFGISGIAAVGLGLVADARGVAWVFAACACLPLLGVFAFWLPATEQRREADPLRPTP